MSAQDLTTQAGRSVRQDPALVSLPGITRVERNGHHYVDGTAALPPAEQQAFLAAHPDLYEHSQGAVRLRVLGRRDRAGLAGGAGLASGAMPEFAAMTPPVGSLPGPAR
jgi:hypothetical protein